MTHSPSPAQAEVFAPVQTTNAFEQLVERVGRAIKLGLLRPGERLPSERDLAERVELSRSTVREAIRVLAEAGYLKTRRGAGGGTFVAQKLPELPPARVTEVVADAGALRDLVAFRLVCELGVAELAAERASAAQLDRLADAIDEVLESPDRYVAYRAADCRFHIGLARTTGSQRLVQMVTELHAAFGELLANLPHSREALLNSTAQHRRVLAAVAQGDGAAARTAMREHVEGTERLLQGILPSL